MTFTACVTHLVMPLWTPTGHARISFMLLMTLLFPTLGKPELKIASKNQHTTMTKSQDTTPHQKKSPYKIGAAVLTNYAHLECSVILCVSSQTCQELSETATSKAGCCSGSIQDIIGGYDPSLLGLLMKTEEQHKVNPPHHPPTWLSLSEYSIHILCSPTCFSSAYDRAYELAWFACYSWRL